MVPVVPMLLMKWVSCTLRVTPDFRRGAFIMRQRIVGIGELVEDDAAALGAQFFRRVARQLHAAFLRGQHQFCAKGAHGLAAFYALVFRHHQYHLVAAHRRRHRQRNAGVAAGRFDQGIARLDFAALFGPHDHRQRGAVFHRAGRIIAFQLGQQHIVGVARGCASA